MKLSAYNVRTIKNDNRALIFNILRKAPASRADIAKRTGLSKSSVTMITNTLISEGQIKEIGTDEVSIGRKPILLDITEDFRFAAGIILHRSDVTVCLTNLKSEVIASTGRPISHFRSADDILDYTSKAVYSLIDDAKLERDKCIGIGISSPGPLDRNAGIILTPPGLPILKNTFAVDGIKNRTGMKNVILENNAVLLAMRENILQSGGKINNFMSVIISQGIGSAIVTNGEIYRGAGGYSGEIGHISVEVGGIKCDCGNTGCLERYVSLDAVKQKFGFDDYRDIVNKAYLADEYATGILRYIACYLRCGLVTAVNLFDLDAVILHGDYSYRPQLLNSMIQKYINEKSFVAQAHSIIVAAPSERLEKAEGNSTAAILEHYFAQKLEV